MRCGWVPEHHRIETPEVSGIAGYIEFKPSICPGYTERLRVVKEVSDAWGWWNQHQLTVKYPEPSPMLMDLIGLYAGEHSQAESWRMDQDR